MGAKDVSVLDADGRERRIPVEELRVGDRFVARPGEKAGASVVNSAEAKVVVWTAFACVAVSILVHGVTASTLSKRWLPEPGSEPGSASSRAA